jgi:hypothetical protein
MSTDTNDPPVRDDMTGFFARGNKLGVGQPNAGNPQTRRMKELRQAVVAATSEGEVLEVMRSMRKAAVGGDVPAARCWLEYVLGRPTQIVNLEGKLEGDPGRLDLTAIIAVISSVIGDDQEKKILLAAKLRELRLPRTDGGKPADGLSG